VIPAFLAISNLPHKRESLADAVELKACRNVQSLY
jgi:hypothetical protein